MTFAQHIEEFRDALLAHAKHYDVELSAEIRTSLGHYYELLFVWNPRLHLVAPCSPTEFATRHVMESLLLLPHLTAEAHVADIGSGAGLPIIPSLIARPDIHAVLIESSQKKAVFLREALRATGTSERSQVIARRFEDVTVPRVNIVTCRALDRFSQMLPILIDWSPRTSTMLLFGGVELQKQIEKANLRFSAIKIPGTERRFLFTVTKH